MALFSQRQGFRPLEKAIQKESIDDELRNGLWSRLVIGVWSKSNGTRAITDSRGELLLLLRRLWIHYYKYSYDTFPQSNSYGSDNIELAIEHIRNNFSIKRPHGGKFMI